VVVECHREAKEMVAVGTALDSEGAGLSVPEVDLSVDLSDSVVVGMEVM